MGEMAAPLRKLENRNNKPGHGSDGVCSHLTCSSLRRVTLPWPRVDAHIVCTPTAGTVFTVLFKSGFLECF